MIMIAHHRPGGFIVSIVTVAFCPPLGTAISCLLTIAAAVVVCFISVVFVQIDQAMWLCVTTTLFLETVKSSKFKVRRGFWASLEDAVICGYSQRATAE